MAKRKQLDPSSVLTPSRPHNPPNTPSPNKTPSKPTPKNHRTPPRKKQQHEKDTTYRPSPPPPSLPPPSPALSKTKTKTKTKKDAGTMKYILVPRALLDPPSPSSRSALNSGTEGKTSEATRVSKVNHRPLPFGRYDEGTVASNVLIAAGQHPWLVGLNMHLGKRFTYIRYKSAAEQDEILGNVERALGRQGRG